MPLSWGGTKKMYFKNDKSLFVEASATQELSLMFPGCWLVAQIQHRLARQTELNCTSN